jgi:hypothetical protein
MRKLSAKQEEAVDIAIGQYWWNQDWERYPWTDADRRQIWQWLQRHSMKRVISLMFQKTQKVRWARWRAEEAARQAAAKPAGKKQAPQSQRFGALYRQQIKKIAAKNALPAPKQRAVREPKLKPEAARRAALGLASKKPRFGF